MAYWMLQNKNTIPAIHVNRVAWHRGQGGLLALTMYTTNNGGRLVRTGLVNNDSVEFGAGMGRMYEVAWSPAGDLLATWGDRAIIWNSNGSFNQELQVPRGEFNCFDTPKFSNDGSFIVLSCKNRMAPTPYRQFNKFDTSTGALQQTLRIPQSMFQHIPVWKDELDVFCEGVNNTINLWRIGQEEPLQTITHTEASIYQMTFNPKTNILAFTLLSAPTRVSLWKTDTPDRAVSLLTDHDAPVGRIVWQSDHSDILATLDVLGGVRIWDTTLRTTLHQYNVLLTYPSRFIRASVSPDGRFIAVAGESEVKIVKFDTGDTAAACEGGGCVATVLEWSPRGDKLAVGLNEWNQPNLSVFNVDMINFGINLKAMSQMRVASLLEGNLVNGEEEARSFLTTKIPKDLVDDVVSYI